MAKSLAEENLTLRAQIEDLKAKARPDGPDTTTKTAISGDDNKQLLDPATPMETIREIRARQRAAGEF